MKKPQTSRPLSILGLIQNPGLQQELEASLQPYDLRCFDSVEAAFEAIYLRYYIPDLVLVAHESALARRFCELFLADLHLALTPLLLIQEGPHGSGAGEDLNVTETLSYPLSGGYLLERVQHYGSQRRTWWKSLHVYGAERPAAVLQALGLPTEKVAYAERGEPRQHQSGGDQFPRFLQFLLQRLVYAAERLPQLPQYTADQVYDLGEALFLDSFQMAGHLADFFELRTISNLDSFELLVGALPDQFCHRNLVLTLLDEAGRQCVAIPNPFQLEVLDLLDQKFKQYELLIAPPELIENVFDPAFRHSEKYRQWQTLRHIRSSDSGQRVDRLQLELTAEAKSVASDTPAGDGSSYHERPRPRAEGVEDRISRAYQAYLDKNAPEAGEAGPQADKVIEEAPIIHLVNCLIEKAQEMGASDIHIEPWENEVVVRFRVDGVLKVIHRLQPRALIRPIATRIKIISRMDVAERRLPQDGNIAFGQFVPGNDLRLRASVVPVEHGEKVVLRLLDSRRNLQQLEDMHFSPACLSLYRQKLHAPYGMILHVGPTGSGKTTSLYAALTELNDPEINIHTIENPIEYRLPGVNQLEVRHEIGLDFARALRAYLRQDPDILLVGEIRDEETAQVAVEAAMTGHLLLSTLHTNDAASTIVRLLEMGIRPYMISSSLLMICAQRLLRRLCLHCRQAYLADAGVKQLLGRPAEPELKLYAAAGCSECHYTGYAGRIGVFELLIPNDALRQAMNQPHVSAEMIKEVALRSTGMYSLYQDGIEKTLQGLTSVEELTLHLVPDETLPRTRQALMPLIPHHRQRGEWEFQAV